MDTTAPPPPPPLILVTGFEPFAGADDNPSARVVERLASDGTAGVVTAVLPVSAGRMPGALDALLTRHRPDVVLGLGEARGSAAVRVERVAENRLDFRTPDNDGQTLTALPVTPGGPTTRLTSLPVDELLDALRRLGVPCEPSDSAGCYLCNQMMYLATAWADAVAPRRRAGFLHLPSLPTQNTSAGGLATMELETAVRAVRAAIRLLQRTPPAEVLPV